MDTFTSLMLLLIVLAIGANILILGLCRAAGRTRPTKNAVRAPHTPPRAPARAISLECVRKGHVIPGWAHNAQVWFCVREGCRYTAVYSRAEDLPYDQEAVAVFDAARAITREAAGGAA